jgi:hypothetical protein
MKLYIIYTRNFLVGIVRKRTHPQSHPMTFMRDDTYCQVNLLVPDLYHRVFQKDPNAAQNGALKDCLDYSEIVPDNSSKACDIRPMDKLSPKQASKQTIKSLGS